LTEPGCPPRLELQRPVAFMAPPPIFWPHRPPVAQQKRPGPPGRVSPVAPHASPPGPPGSPGLPPPAQAKHTRPSPSALPVRPVAQPRASAIPVPAAQAKRGAVPGSAAQAFFKVQPGGRADELPGRLLAMDRLNRNLGAEMLKRCVDILYQSKIQHGLIDVDNEQQVALLYWNAVRVSKRFTDTGSAIVQELEELVEKTAHRISSALRRASIYKLAIIGAGSSAAYYIDTLGPAYDHSFTLLLGNADPWGGERGLEAIDFINHTEGQIGYPSQGVPDFTDRFLGRRAFSDKTRRIITEAIPVENRFDEKIVSIDQQKNGLYIITSRDRHRTNTRKAKKVVIASGAGPHKRTDAAIEGGAERVMDMDRFVREIATGGVKTTGRVIVQGPNAAIDAVAAAQRYHWDVRWFINTSPPVYLPGTRYYLGRIPLFKATGVKIGTRENGTLEVRANVQPYTGGDHQYAYDKDRWGGKGDQTFNVDYFVYGIGQDVNAEGSVGQFLAAGLRNQLEPSYDRSGRYSEVKEGRDISHIYDTKVALGLRTTGSTASRGIEVIGAAAKALATKEQVGELAKVTRFLTADVLAYEQLGGIRSAMHGLNEYTPPSIVRDVDFSSADPTVLRQYITLNYPDVTERDAREVINTILAHRRTGHHPHGYDDWWIRHWKQVLETRNEWGRRG
jgi:hypothetical protein